VYLFDFVTLARIHVLNKALNREASKELRKMNRTTEILKHLHSDATSRVMKFDIIVRRLSLADVWNIFGHQHQTNAMNALGRVNPPRYAYIASVEDDQRNVQLAFHMTSAHEFGLLLNSHNVLNIGIMPYTFGDAVFGYTITDTMARMWEMLDLMADGLNHCCVCDPKYVSWNTANLRIMKIDTQSRKAYVSEAFALRNLDLEFPHISTYFTRKANPNSIRGVVFSLLMQS
jgi:hypothetical protein